MPGLKASGSFVERTQVIPGDKKRSTQGLIAVGLLLTMLMILGFLGTVWLTGAPENANSYAKFRSVQSDLGVGNNTPAIAVDDEHDVFAIAWYGYDKKNDVWNLNVTLVGTTDGSILLTNTITKDLNIYNGRPDSRGPRIAYDPDDDAYLLIWYSQNKSLDGALLDDHAGIIYGPFVINSTSASVDYHAFGLSYAGNHQFNVVWSNTAYRTYFRPVIVDTSNNPPVSLGVEKMISADTSHSHVDHAVATDIGEGATIVAWRNSTGTSGRYNITAKIFDAKISEVYRNDFTVADGFNDGKAYNFPNVAAGSGEFMVVYANYYSPYDVHAKLYSSDGTLIKSIDIMDTSSAIRYYGIGVAYNGSGGFVVVFPDSNRNIVAFLYDLDGNLVWQKTIVADGNSNEGARVAVNPNAGGKVTYQFVWYDYSNGVVRASWWQESELVPEFSVIVPILVVLVAATIYVRRR